MRSRFDLQGLDAFAEEHAATLESLGVQKQELVTKTRLMALLALASSAHDIDFATIQVSAVSSRFPII